MKMLIAMILVSYSASAAYWQPHIKELAALEWKAQHTPEMKLARQYSKIEEIRVDRAYYDSNNECGEEVSFFGRITNLPTSLIPSPGENLQKLSPCHSYP